MIISELAQQGISELTAAGIPDCMSDVYLLLGHSLKKSRTQLLAAARDEVPTEALQEFIALLRRRKTREPVAYILGEQEFWSKSFIVNSSVLIPRPETELLLETVFKELRSNPLSENGKIIDLCCGSGVIAIILALELKRNIIGIDLSERALAVTRKNCQRHGVGDSVSLIQSDLLTAIEPHQQVSLVVSNPPYVTTHAVNYEVEPEVGKFEPHMALDGGELGLDLIERIRHDLPLVLAPQGQLFMEIGYDQGEATVEMFSKSISGLRDFDKIEILKDYAGHDRILHARMS
jgi:release factor glutamine methyltransferase